MIITLHNPTPETLQHTLVSLVHGGHYVTLVSHGIGFDPFAGQIMSPLIRKIKQGTGFAIIPPFGVGEVEVLVTSNNGTHDQYVQIHCTDSIHSLDPENLKDFYKLAGLWSRHLGLPYGYAVSYGDGGIEFYPMLADYNQGFVFHSLKAVKAGFVLSADRCVAVHGYRPKPLLRKQGNELQVFCQTPFELFERMFEFVRGSTPNAVVSRPPPVDDSMESLIKAMPRDVLQKLIEDALGRK